MGASSGDASDAAVGWTRLTAGGVIPALLQGAAWLFSGSVVVVASLLGTGPSTKLHLAIVRSGFDLPYQTADTLLLLLAGGFLLAVWGVRRVDVDRVLVGLTAGSAAIASYLTNEVLKRLFGKQRPCVELVVDPRCPGPESWSFPSNHATIAFALATATVLVALTRWAWCVYIIATIAAVSRVADGVHYPHDVVAGAAVGTCVTVCTVLLLRCAVRCIRRRDGAGRAP